MCETMSHYDILDDFCKYIKSFDKEQISELFEDIDKLQDMYMDNVDFEVTSPIYIYKF